MLVRTITTWCGCKDDKMWGPNGAIWLFLCFASWREAISHTDNLSKDLQGTKMAAVSGQRLTNATKEMLTKIHTDQRFDHFLLLLPTRVKDWLVNKKAMHSGQTRGWCWCTKLPQTAKHHLRRIYYEAIDLIIKAIDQCVNHKSFSSYTRWRPSCLKLLMVMTMRQSSSFLKHHTAKMLIQGCYLGIYVFWKLC